MAPRKRKPSALPHSKVIAINEDLIKLSLGFGPNVPGEYIAMVYENNHEIYTHNIDPTKEYNIHFRESHVLVTETNQLQTIPVSVGG